MPARLSTQPLKKGMCVIGEADPFLANLLQRFAEKKGFLTRRVQTGEAVLKTAQEDCPAVIFLEPELPGKLRGWEAARALFANPETRAIPLVICAWMSETEVWELVGAQPAYLQKPDLHYEGFQGALEVAVQKSQRSDHAA